MKKVVDAIMPGNREVSEECLMAVNDDFNRTVRAYGYSPTQHLFGSDHAIPTDLMGENGYPDVVVNSWVLSGDENYLLSHRIREAARYARLSEEDEKAMKGVLAGSVSIMPAGSGTESAAARPGKCPKTHGGARVHVERARDPTPLKLS